jgi:hypothetical protein
MKLVTFDVDLYEVNSIEGKLLCQIVERNHWNGYTLVRNVSPGGILGKLHLGCPISDRCIDDIDVFEIVRLDVDGQAFCILLTCLCGDHAAASRMASQMHGLDTYIRADVEADRILGDELAAEGQEFLLVIIAEHLEVSVIRASM